MIFGCGMADGWVLGLSLDFERSADNFPSGAAERRVLHPSFVVRWTTMIEPPQSPHLRRPTRTLASPTSSSRPAGRREADRNGGAGLARHPTAVSGTVKSAGPPPSGDGAACVPKRERRRDPRNRN